ncbi:hypothetical protein E2C01_020307 [Portunus trituberculatus]|uniref:Uncharacterized protein n=1 Tax=Portunus trituberculatus TaxID=210409 RepID=A0A5B7E0Y3_PORTR|nr:hypothetical protein [Portunus trituberculatus]
MREQSISEYKPNSNLTQDPPNTPACYHHHSPEPDEGVHPDEGTNNIQLNHLMVSKILLFLVQLLSGLWDQAHTSATQVDSLSHQGVEGAGLREAMGAGMGAPLGQAGG